MLYSWKGLDYVNSACPNLILEPVESDSGAMTGAWSYNSATHKLIIVFEFDEAGLPVEEASEVDAIQVNNRNLVIVDNSDPTDPYYTRFERF
jgi:hypothetical protein